MEKIHIHVHRFRVKFLKMSTSDTSKDENLLKG